VLSSHGPDLAAIPLGHKPSFQTNKQQPATVSHWHPELDA
jgi:hypothetical protein